MAWREDLYDKYFSLTDQYKIGQETMKHIVDALKFYARNDPIDSATFPSSVRQAIYDQSLIGWENWYKGRIAKSWSSVITTVPGEKDFLKTILSHTLSQCRELWLQRNAVVHGHNSNAHSIEKK